MARGMLGLLLVTAWTGLVTAGSPIPVRGQLNSDLHLHLGGACPLDKPFRFDVHKGSEQIGSYDGGLQGLKGYVGRLEYSNFTVTLKNLTESDGTKFTATLYYDVSGTMKPCDLHYEVVLLAPSSSPYTEATTRTPADLTAHNVSGNSTDGTLSFVSFCLSLDSPVNALFTFVPSILAGCFKEIRLDGMEAADQINCVFTVVFQVLSIGTMCGGSFYGWLLLPITITLLVVWLLPCVPAAPAVTRTISRCCCSSSVDDMNSSCVKNALKALNCLTLLFQLLFAVCAGLLHYRFNGDISRREPSMVRYMFLSIGLSIVWRITVFIGTYCYKSGSKKFTAVRKDEPKPAAGDPKGDSETPV